jgi:nucleoside 2-deoxyribosyltransferase
MSALGAIMQICYAQQPLTPSIFLAGPTPRDANTPSWRPEAVAKLARMGFRGTVFVPEHPSGGLPPDSYDAQISWEWAALDQATVVVFWVPRELATLPGFTTNVEFGYLAASSKLILGFPDSADKMRYMDRLAARHGIPVFSTLEETLEAAIEKTKTPHPFMRVLRNLAF